MSGPASQPKAKMAAAATDGLHVTSPLSARLATLDRLGFSASVLSDLLSVSPEAVYQWSRGDASPRRGRLQTLDDLRCAVATLLAGQVGEDGVLPWFMSRPSARASRPMDLLVDHPVMVLTAAEAFAAGREDIAIKALESAGSRSS